MTRFLFVRHTAHDLLGQKIAGRMANVHLNEIGQRAAVELAHQLSHLQIDAIYSGPLERVRETAEPVAQQLRIPVQIAPELDELDMGEWTGRTFAELTDEPLWKAWNSFRSCTRVPGGELMLEVQARLLRKISRLSESDGCIALFSHGDVIRAALAHFLGLHLDFLFRIEVDPGSVSVVDLHRDAVVVRGINLPAAALSALTNA
jgi:broad specificity phosphatase PhoE